MRRGLSRSQRKMGTPSPEERNRIVVFTEGEKTEVSYLEYWTRLNRGAINVHISRRHGVPWSLVKWAAERRRAEGGHARPGRWSAEYWCVFDVNSHSRIPDCVEMARANDINLAVSNLCIELWFILHFKDQDAHLERHDAQRHSRLLLEWDKKALPGEVLEKLATRYDDARVRAQRLDTKHHGDGRRPRSNPSSDIWKLVDRIRNA